MAILAVNLLEIGTVGVQPRIVFIHTNDTLNAVTATGYLNSVVPEFKLSETDICAVTTRDSVTSPYNVGWFEIIKVGKDYNLTATASPGSVELPTIANYIAHFTDAIGELSSAPANVINAGNIQAGLSGVKGTLASYPMTASRGALVIEANANTGDNNVTIQNAQHSQASVITIPDGGQAASNIILSNSAATQVISTGGLQVAAGNIVAGDDASSGYLEAHPPTTNSGTLRVSASDNSSDVLVNITNADHGQATTYVIPDAGVANGSILSNALALADVNSNIVSFDVAITAAGLASAGTIILYASSGSKRFRIRELFLNDGGTDFSGGGGDRDVSINDGSTVLSLIPAASIQTVANSRWGDVGLPFPGLNIPINTLTQPGAPLEVNYSGGTADYAAGSVVISGVLERIV